MRLVDIAPMLEHLDLEHYDKDYCVNQFSADWIYSWLDSQPTIDAVPVVRCRDCDNMTFIADPAQKPGMFCTLVMAEVDRNDFCSYGERKEDDT